MALFLVFFSISRNLVLDVKLIICWVKLELIALIDFFLLHWLMTFWMQEIFSPWNPYSFLNCQECLTIKIKNAKELIYFSLLIFVVSWTTQPSV